MSVISLFSFPVGSFDPTSIILSFLGDRCDPLALFSIFLEVDVTH